MYNLVSHTLTRVLQTIYHYERKLGTITFLLIFCLDIYLLRHLEHKATILKGGIRKSNQAEKYAFGYRLFDKVQFNGQDCFIFGRRTSGYFVVKTIDGKVIHNSASFKKLKLVERASNYLIA